MGNGNKTIATLIILFIPFLAEAGGGWPQPKNSWYLKIYEWWILSNQHYTSSGGIDPNATRGTYFTNLYAEYGITERFTGILYLPFFARVTLHEQVSGTNGGVIAEGDALNSIGDIDFAIKYALIRNKPVVVSATLLLGFPTGTAEGGNDGSLQTGDGEFNQLLRVDVSGSIKVGNKYPYASSYFGYNNRTGGYSDEFVFGLETGITLNKWIPIIRFDAVLSTRNGDPNFNSDGTSLFSNNREYLAISPEINYSIKDKMGVTANAGFAVKGKLIFANPSYSIGVFFKL